MTDPTPADVPPQPLGDADASITPDAQTDAAQNEWDATAVDGAVDPDDATATAGEPVDLEEIPAEDRPAGAQQPESQGEDPVNAALGEEGQGDLAPEDL